MGTQLSENATLTILSTFTSADAQSLITAANKSPYSCGRTKHIH